jgi:hypothetical protein
MRKPCEWFENGEECGKPSVSQMGTGEDAWPLCAEHEDQIIREANQIPDITEDEAREMLEDDDPGRDQEPDN